MYSGDDYEAELSKDLEAANKEIEELDDKIIALEAAAAALADLFEARVSIVEMSEKEFDAVRAARGA